MTRVGTSVDYGTHVISHTWEKDEDLYCPNCGKQEVWVEDGAGDYYVGEDYVCAACGWVFNMPSLGPMKNTYVEIVKQIRENAP